MKDRSRKPVQPELTINPFVSAAQQRACYAKKAAGEAGSWDCEEWQANTPSNLPERKRKAKLTRNARAKQSISAVKRARTEGKAANPLRYDPTRTVTLRRQFEKQLERRFQLLKGKIVQYVVQQNGLGLTANADVSGEARDDKGRWVKVDYFGEPLDVMANPSKEELETWAKRAGGLRGAIIKGVPHVWENFLEGGRQAIHSVVTEKLGEFDSPRRRHFYVNLKGEGRQPTVESYHGLDASPEIASWVKKLGLTANADVSGEARGQDGRWIKVAVAAHSSETGNFAGTPEHEILVNPSTEQLTNWLKGLKGPDKELNGLVYGGVAHVWEPNTDAVKGGAFISHDAVAEKMGLHSLSWGKRFRLELENGRPLVKTYAGAESSPAVVEWAKGKGLTVNTDVSEEARDEKGRWVKAQIGTWVGEPGEPGKKVDIPHDVMVDPSKEELTNWAKKLPQDWEGMTRMGEELRGMVVQGHLYVWEPKSDISGKQIYHADVNEGLGHTVPSEHENRCYIGLKDGELRIYAYSMGHPGNALVDWGQKRGITVNVLASDHESAAALTAKPTEAQKKAGNYRKGQFRWNGLLITVETPKGAKRRDSILTCHYGYVNRTVGADGDQVDVFIGPDLGSDKVYVIDQVKPVANSNPEGCNQYTGPNCSKDSPKTREEAVYRFVQGTKLAFGIEDDPADPGVVFPFTKDKFIICSLVQRGDLFAVRIHFATGKDVRSTSVSMPSKEDVGLLRKVREAAETYHRVGLALEVVSGESHRKAIYEKGMEKIGLKKVSETEDKEKELTTQLWNQEYVFDEHKCMIGWDNIGDAVAAYLSNYPKGWKLGPVREMTVAQFKEWLQGFSLNYQAFVTNEGIGYFPCPTSLIEVPDIRQPDHYSCGAASAMAVGKYFGVGPDTIQEWKDALGTDVEESTRPHAIYDYLKSLGSQVEIVGEFHDQDEWATMTGNANPNHDERGRFASASETTPVEHIKRELAIYAKLGYSAADVNSGECEPLARRVIDAVRAAGGQADYGIPNVGLAHIWVVSGGKHYDAQHPLGVSSPKQLTFFKDDPELLSEGWTRSEKNPVTENANPEGKLQGVKALASYTNKGWPVICPVQDYGPAVPAKARFDYGHYLTVIGVAMGYVFCQDSSEDNVIAGGDKKKLAKVGSIQKPGRIIVAEEDWLKMWYDEDVDGNKYVRFGIAVGPPANWQEQVANLNPYHDEHGRFATAGGDNAALAIKAKRGGFTYKPLQGRSPKTGFVVSLPREAGWEKPVSIERFKKHGQSLISSYLHKVRDALKRGDLDAKHAHVGAWRDDKTGRVVLDVNEVYQSKKEAMNAGKQRRQDAIFDLSTFTEIDLRDERGKRPEGAKLAGNTGTLDGAGNRPRAEGLGSPAIPGTGWGRVSNADTDRLQAFQEFLRYQLDLLLTGKTEEQLWDAYIAAGYKKGLGRAFDDTRQADLRKRRPELFIRESQDAVRDFYEGTKDEFLRSSFDSPPGRERVKLLASRTFDEMENVTADMANKMGRVLTDGLIQGKGANEIAKQLNEQADLGLNRSRLVARTEIVRAHAQGQLAAFKQLGVQQLGVQVEFATAGDDRVCPSCDALEGTIFDIEDADGVIPVHPQCRCAFIPAGVGEDSDEGE